MQNENNSLSRPLSVIGHKFVTNGHCSECIFIDSFEKNSMMNCSVRAAHPWHTSSDWTRLPMLSFVTTNSCLICLFAAPSLTNLFRLCENDWLPEQNVGLNVPLPSIYPSIYPIHFSITYCLTRHFIAFYCHCITSYTQRNITQITYTVVTNNIFILYMSLTFSLFAMAIYWVSNIW